MIAAYILYAHATSQVPVLCGQCNLLNLRYSWRYLQNETSLTRDFPNFTWYSYLIPGHRGLYDTSSKAWSIFPQYLLQIAPLSVLRSYSWHLPETTRQLSKGTEGSRRWRNTAVHWLRIIGGNWQQYPCAMKRKATGPPESPRKQKMSKVALDKNKKYDRQLR